MRTFIREPTYRWLSIKLPAAVVLVTWLSGALADSLVRNEALAAGIVAVVAGLTARLLVSRRFGRIDEDALSSSAPGSRE
jgi:hypothetical protein